MEPTAHVFQRDLKRPYPIIARAEGVYLYDEEGHRYLDGCSGALVTNLGHGVREIIEAICEQSERVCFAHQSRFTTRPAIDLSRRLASMAPGDLDKVWIVSGGSEATESALKMARQYFLERDGRTCKYRVIARRLSYHGATIGALSMTGHPGRRSKFAPLLSPAVTHISAPYCYRCPYEDEYPGCSLRCAQELGDAIRAEGPDNVAAFIAEPVGGAAGGGITPPPGYYEVIQETCRRYDVVFIADEVMCGMGRTGTNFAIEHWQALPDIIVTAKGIGAGYAPLGAVIASSRLYQAFEEGTGKFAHGYTYGGNPLSCAVGDRVLRYMEERNIVERAREAGDYLWQAMERLKSIPIVGDIRGKGLLVGVELVRDKATKEPFETRLGVAERVTRLALSKGLVIYPGGGTANGCDGDHFLIGPPLVIDKAGMDTMVEILEETLNESVNLLKSF